MSRDELVKDADRMENICILLGDRQDIWQDRLVYWIAVAVLHLLQDAVKRKDKECSKQS